MCEFSKKITAWLDGELSTDDATAVEHHLGGCEECRLRLETYRGVSSALQAYCDAYAESVMVNKAGRERSRWAIASALTAGAAIAAVFLVSARTPVRSPAIPNTHVAERAAAAAPRVLPGDLAQTDAAPAATSVQRERARPRRVRASTSAVQAQETRWPADEPMLEIAVPGDAIFAPGAFPEGMGITVDVTLAPDGWPQQMQMRPQLAEFERRATQP